MGNSNENSKDALIKELQSKIARQKNDLQAKSDQIRQLREDKAKLLMELRQARGSAG